MLVTCGLISTIFAEITLPDVSIMTGKSLSSTLAVTTDWGGGEGFLGAVWLPWVE